MIFIIAFYGSQKVSIQLLAVSSSAIKMNEDRNRVYIKYLAKLTSIYHKPGFLYRYHVR